MRTLGALLAVCAAALPVLGGPARVRLTLTDGTRLEGELLRHREGEYRVRVGADERVLPAAVVSAAEVLEEDRRPIDLEVVDRPLGEVVEELARGAGRTAHVDSSCAARPVTTRLRQAAWLRALEVVARCGRCSLEPEGVALRLRPLVDLSLRDIPAQAAIARLGAAAGQQILIDPQVSGLVTVELQAAPLGPALDALGWALALEVERGGPAWTARRQAARPPFPAWVGPRLGIAAELPPGQPVTLGASGRSIQEVCAEIAEQAFPSGPERVEVLVDPDVPPLAVNLRLQVAPWRTALAEAARLAGCRLETVTPRLVLVSRPRGVVRAAKAPPGPLLALLAATAGKGVVVGPEVRGLLGFEMHGVDPREVLHRLAHSLGWEVVLIEDQVFAVGGKQLEPGTPPDPPFPPEGTLTLGGVTRPRPRVQALVIGCGRDRVLLDGRAYAAGEELRAADGQPTGLRVERIGADGVDLVVGEERERVVLTGH